ncbi:MAG: carbonic anhydrase, partial [Limnobacter sp.]|nr:carbonic anhydrase [Limnobacter sp.]
QARKHGLFNMPHLTEEQKLCLLSEINVIEQVRHLCESTLIEDAWQRGQALTVHGWVYSLKDGLLRNLEVCIQCDENLEDQHAQAIQAALARYAA